jgi:hypothetical protein
MSRVRDTYLAVFIAVVLTIAVYTGVLVFLPETEPLLPVGLVGVLITVLVPSAFLYRAEIITLQNDAQGDPA